MGIPREILEQVARLVRPIATRTANMIARGVVQLADDDKKAQLLQLGVLFGETVDNAEHFQQYGFSSVPLAGAEVVMLFPNGDRSHPLVIATTDRSSRPTGGDPGDVTLYHYKGAKVLMLDNGDVEIQPGPGGHVYARSDGGSSDRLVKKSEFDNHLHLAGTLTTSFGAVTGASGAPTVPATGTTKFEAE